MSKVYAIVTLKCDGNKQANYAIEILEQHTYSPKGSATNGVTMQPNNCPDSSIT